MKYKRLWSGIGASASMLILILDSKTALEGARGGIELCVKTVIPSLFPFFLLSILLTSSFMGSSLGLLRPLGRLCGVPKGAESILIAGFLGGYPVGAQAIANASRSGRLHKPDAERLLAFCNNAGPAFLFGMASSLFPRQWMAWTLWGIHITSAVLVSILIPGDAALAVRLDAKEPISVSAVLNSAIRVMATVCGWVVLFRIVISFLSRWILWVLPTAVQVGIIGLLELSNGCCELTAVSDMDLRFVMCSGMLAFGGLCVTMQTVSVTSGLSLRYYFLGKLLQMVFSLLLSAAVMADFGLSCCVALLASAFLLRKMQKKSSIRAVAGV